METPTKAGHQPAPRPHPQRRGGKNQPGHPLGGAVAGPCCCSDRARRRGRLRDDTGGPLCWDAVARVALGGAARPTPTTEPRLPRHTPLGAARLCQSQGPPGGATGRGWKKNRHAAARQRTSLTVKRQHGGGRQAPFKKTQFAPPRSRVRKGGAPRGPPPAPRGSPSHKLAEVIGCPFAPPGAVGPRQRAPHVGGGERGEACPAARPSVGDGRGPPRASGVRHSNGSRRRGRVGEPPRSRGSTRHGPIPSKRASGRGRVLSSIRSPGRGAATLSPSAPTPARWSTAPPRTAASRPRYVVVTGDPLY